MHSVSSASRGNPLHLPERGVLVRGLVRMLDAQLRTAHGIIEYCDDNRCLLRVERAAAPRTLRLADGTLVTAGDPIVLLHIWNEHVPKMSGRGADIRWASEVRRSLLLSFRALATRLTQDSALQDVKAVRARLKLARFDHPEVARLLGRRFGFEEYKADAPNPDALHDGLEDVWLWALAWTFNPDSRKRRRLSYMGQDLWASRARFVSLHGAPDARLEPVGHGQSAPTAS